MKIKYHLLLFSVIAIVLISCSPKTDFLKFVRENTSPSGTEYADYQVTIGNQIGGAKVIPELWQDGICTEGPPVIITHETKELHIILSVNGLSTQDGTGGVNVQINTDESSGSVLTYFQLPSQVTGYSFSAYHNQEKIEISGKSEKILGALVFDTGSGIETVDCRELADTTDLLSSYSCILIIRASFTEEPIFPQQEEPVSDFTIS